MKRATAWGRSPRSHFEDWPGSVRDDHLVVAHRVPDLGERLQRHRVADDAVAALDPGCTPGLQRRVQPLPGTPRGRRVPGPAAGMTSVAWIGPRSPLWTRASMSSGAAAVRLASTIT